MLAENYRDLPKDTFARLNRDGLIEVVSRETGQVLALQKSADDIFREKKHFFQKHTLEDGTVVYVENGLSLDKIFPRKSPVFSWVLADVIAQRIAEGETLTAICKEENMPSYSAVARWRKSISEFDGLIEQAMKDAAQHSFDELKKLAESIVDDDSAKVATAKAAIYKFIAERANPDRFATKKPDVKFIGARILRIDTGVPPPNDTQVAASRDVTPMLEGGNNGQEEESKEKSQAEKEVVLVMPPSEKESDG